jgi:hypothetical protein
VNLRALPLIRTRLAFRPAVRLALDVGLAVGLFWATAAAYRGAAGHHQMADSAYALTVSEKLLIDRTADLRDCVPADATARRGMYCYDAGQDLPYQMLRKDDAVYYGYPLGSSVLSVPFVRHYGTGRGLSVIGPDGVPNAALEAELQVKTAGRVSAAIVVLFYLLVRFFCPPLTAALVAAGFGFGSPVYSTLARALWSHTWAVFWVAAAVVLLVAARRVKAPTWRTDLALGVGLGTVLFWAAFCRQHAAISAFAAGAYLLLHHRRVLLVTVLAGGLWSVALVLISRGVFGSNLPPTVYTAGTIDGKDVLNRFAWLMVSPSRGLLVFCPYLAVVGVLLAGCRRHLTDAGLLFPAALAVLTHTAVFSAYSGWHGGSSYGPRYFCDILPWFVLLTAMGVGALSKVTEVGFPWRKALAAMVLLACFGWGVFVHSRGANSVPAWYWNHRAIAVGHEAAVKEWAHPQFLAGLTFEVERDGSVQTPR